MSNKDETGLEDCTWMVDHTKFFEVGEVLSSSPFYPAWVPGKQQEFLNT